MRKLKKLIVALALIGGYMLYTLYWIYLLEVLFSNRRDWNLFYSSSFLVVFLTFGLIGSIFVVFLKQLVLN